MLRASCLALPAAVLLLSSAPAIAQQSLPPGVGGYDEPCTAAVAPLGDRPVEQLVPGGVPPAARARVRGVVSRAFTWRPGETLRVCFRSGTQKARARVAAIAGEWTQYANLTLDFGDPADPRLCQPDAGDAIKIDFVNTGPKAGYWSAVGKASLKADHSMNLSYLGDDELPRFGKQQMEMAEARRLILHEFGHAIGLFHEHQSPKAGCDVEYDEEAVVAFGWLHGWDAQRSKFNIMQYPDRPEFNATEVDRQSIMHYALPPWLFKSGEKSPCFTKTNYDLSEHDKAFIASVYPKGTGPLASARSTRSVQGSAGTAGLLTEYRRSLQEAGIAPAEIEQLAAAFKAALP